MSREIKGLTIAFDKPLNEEHVDELIKSFKMIRHVGDVKPIGEEMDDYFAKTQLRHDFIMKFYDFINKELKE